MKKSRLLIFIESQSLNSNNKVSMALFFGTTLKAVVHGIDPTKFESDAKSTEELAAVKELFDKRDIIVSSTLEKWLGIEKTHRSSFYEMLFYERIIDQFSAKGVEELTLDMVCGAILDEPTDEIKRIIVSQNSDGSPENVDELRAMREEFLARLQNMSEDSSSPDKEANEEKPEPKAKKTAEEPKLDLSFENLVEKTEELKLVRDKYPILGDLPLIGRLFQTKGRNAQKYNLLIFLSCRIVNPDGSPLRERENRGLPPFQY